jgi:serine/threonine protein kinase
MTSSTASGESNPFADFPTDLPADPDLTYSPETSALSLSAPANSTIGIAPPQWSVASRSIFSQVTVPPGSKEAAEPASPESAASGPADSAPTFELLRLVGRGGMGEIWEARQRSLGRLVAIKAIRAELLAQLRDDPQARETAFREFEQEALAGAQLDHPNIVPVYDLGSAEGAAFSPLLAMKLVRGESWEKTLRDDFKTLPAADFLAKHLPILIDMAQAVAFAHSRGIIHRDLKPAQVITGEFGEALLMDWGLAIHIGLDAMPASASSEWAAPFQDEAVLSRLSTPLSATNPAGTPALMAPEQTDPDAKRLGPWTDVYLLGGTLYHLLTGSYPHSAGNSLAAMRKAMIGDVEPPSQRAAERSREVPPELEKLCLAALAKEPKNRLSSAKEFIKGLQGYLSGASKRRESETLGRQAREKLEALDKESALSAHDAYIARGAAADLLERALRLWPENIEALRQRGRNLAARIELEIGQGDLLLARVHLSQFAEAASTGLFAAQEVQTLTKALERAIQHRETARRLRRVLLTAALLLFGSTAIFGVLAVLSAREARRERDRAQAAQEESEQARAEAEDLIGFMLYEMRDKLAPLGRLDLLAKTASQALDHYARRPPDWNSPSEIRDRAAAFANIGDVLRLRDNPEDALKAHREALSLAERLRDLKPDSADALATLGGQYVNVGLILDQSGAPAEEIIHFLSQGEALLLEALRREPHNLDHRFRLATCQINWGRALREKANQPEEALKKHAEALKIAIEAEKEVADNPKGLAEWQRLRLTVSSAAARALNSLGRFEEALALCQKAEAEALAFREKEPKNAIWPDLASGFAEIRGSTLAGLGRPDEAGQAFAESVAILRPLVEADPSNMELLERLGQDSFNAAAAWLRDPKRFPEAEKLMAKSAELRQRLASVKADDELLNDLAFTLEALGYLRFQLSMPGPAEEALAQATALRRQQAQDSGNDPKALLRWAECLSTLTQARAGINDLEGALAATKELVAVCRELLAVDPDNAAQWRGELAGALVQQASLESVAGETNKAFATLEEAIAAGWNAGDSLASDPNFAPLAAADPERFAALLESVSANADRAAPQEESSEAKE